MHDIIHYRVHIATRSCAIPAIPEYVLAYLARMRTSGRDIRNSGNLERRSPRCNITISSRVRMTVVNRKVPCSGNGPIPAYQRPSCFGQCLQNETCRKNALLPRRSSSSHEIVNWCLTSLLAGNVTLTSLSGWINKSSHD